jgi:tetratricopeptide (TPR) repeat protein
MNALLQRAVDAHRAGRLAEADQLYAAVPPDAPVYADALALRAVLATNDGRAEQAVVWAQQAVALDPSAGLFYFYLANAETAAGQPRAAEESFRAALARAPQMVEGWYNYGNLLQSLDRAEDAASAYRAALRLDPAHALAANNLALMYEKLGQPQEGVACLLKLLEQNPTFAQGARNLCVLAEQAGDYGLARLAGEKAVHLAPTDAESWFGLGVARNRLGLDAAAVAAYERALALRPTWADAWDNLGQSYQFLGDLPRAESAYRKRIDLAGQAIPDEAVAATPEDELGNYHWHLALLELLKGDWTQGFARYKARFAEVAGIKRPFPGRPLWQGQDLSGRTLLLYDEQGFGDTLMLARYAPLLRARGARLVVWVGAPLAPLFETWDVFDAVYARPSLPPLDVDYHASFFDLPFLFGTTPETVPLAEGYLPCPTGPSSPRARKTIGLVWAGTPLHKHDARRSVPLRDLAALVEGRNATFVSLTRDERAGDAERMAALGIVDLASQLTDFRATAKRIAELDLLITCDTSTAHLAGALGKPVWILLPYAPDWRWGPSGTTTPWYRSARLFRQPTPGLWPPVLAALRTELEGFLKG